MYWKFQLPIFDAHNGIIATVIVCARLYTCALCVSRSAHIWSIGHVRWMHFSIQFVENVSLGMVEMNFEELGTGKL